jgi:3-deoxy-manno-octulosonate cytidylyltransferase (CMP-KDO synthetase)
MCRNCAAIVDTRQPCKLSCYPVNPTGANPHSKSKSNVVAIIPARFDSTRLPGKALLEIAGKPMICRVVERALAASKVTRVIVATDDERIRGAVETAGYEVVMTRGSHVSGTDRVAEVAERLTDTDIIVNIQGDEPLISAATIDRAVDVLARESGIDKSAGVKDTGEKEPAGIVTTFEAIDSIADVLNPDVVKIVLNDRGKALYFSRSPVPYPRDAVRKFGTIEAALRNESRLLCHFRKHTGLYVYRREVLLQFAGWPRSELETLESLEQLRALEHGITIRAIEAITRSIGVDTVEDLERVRAIVDHSEAVV